MAVSVSMGVMKPVLGKLIALMGDEYKKLKGLRKEVSFLKRELSDMNALLEKMDDADELDQQAKNWRKDIIEMSYDIEDCIDQFMDRVGDKQVGILQKASHYLRTFKDRRHLANQLQEIKTLVIQASDRRKRYMIDQCITVTNRVAVDPRLTALYQKSKGLVGMESQKEELVKWVTMDDDVPQLKVVSIVGFGGLGKTTLANEVYHQVKEHFDCMAFVSVSQKPDIIRLLSSILKQLGLHVSLACEEKDLINDLNGHLQDKRYFIVVDDLWDIRAWNTISCAFPQNKHSRAMVTTRNEDVGRVCSSSNHGSIHNMKSLSEEDSGKLFFSRIFGFEDDCPPHLIEVAGGILKKCGGLPLAIVTVASMLACQPARSKGQWEYIQNSLGVESTTNTNFEDMMEILDLSYKHLPHHLKACFLYLGTYPEDHAISRVDLVRRWVAEGFVSYSPDGHDLWDVADSYFNELANRSMIQPAYENDYIAMPYCRVHDMMLELIVRRCKEDNFIYLVDDPQQMLPKGQDKVIHRLTLDLRDVKSGTIIDVTDSSKHLSRVRSLNIFGGSNWMPPLLEFKLLRVLFLDICSSNKTTIDLTCISQLSQLRYSKIVGNGSNIVLPAQIRGLQRLETLDLSRLQNTSCNNLPEIDDVPRLSHLSVPIGTRLPEGIGKMKSLQTLCGFSLPVSSSVSITGLGELTALSELIFNCDAISMGSSVPIVIGNWMATLCDSLEKLGSLKVLSAWSSDVAWCADPLLRPSFSPPFRNLEQLHMPQWTLSNIPKWIGHLHNLSELALGVKQVLQEDIAIIGMQLPSLVGFYLRIPGVPTETIVIRGSTGFQHLKWFMLNCERLSCLAFEAGAMPNLMALELAMDPQGWDQATPRGMQHLTGLKRIKVTATKLYKLFRTMEEEEIEDELLWDVFQQAIDALPTCPALTFHEGSRVIRPEEEDSMCDSTDGPHLWMEDNNSACSD